VLLAVVDEDLADRLADGADDVEVGVAEADVEQLGGEPADRALAGAGRADEDQQRPHRTASPLR
jgi:hypothetical protein